MGAAAPPCDRTEGEGWCGAAAVPSSDAGTACTTSPGTGTRHRATAAGVLCCAHRQVVHARHVQDRAVDDQQAFQAGEPLEQIIRQGPQAGRTCKRAEHCLSSGRHGNVPATPTTIASAKAAKGADEPDKPEEKPDMPEEKPDMPEKNPDEEEKEEEEKELSILEAWAQIIKIVLYDGHRKLSNHLRG